MMERSIMGNTQVATNEEIEARLIRLAERPISFAEFLDLNIDSAHELIDGVMVAKMAAQWEHERLIVWLGSLLHAYTQHRRLGSVAISRMTVKINDHRGRLPDLLFIRQEQSGIIEQRAVNGVPDLVIELISPNDRPSDRIALETDYCALGVPEILFIDQQKRRVQLLRKQGEGYRRQKLAAGPLELTTIPGFVIQVDWLFQDPQPDTFNLLRDLLNE
jgi:Uma2 family endonuclease